MGFHGINSTDHMDFTTKQFNAYLDEIARYQATESDLRIFRGMEMRARDREGNPNAPKELPGTAEVIIGVVHSVQSKNGKGKHSPSEFMKKNLLDLGYAISLKLFENERVTMLGLQ